MSLNLIFIENLQDFNATLNSISLNKSNLDIKKIFPHQEKYYYISRSGLSYKLLGYGISISLEKIDDDLFIKYLQISPKLIK